MEQQLKKIIGDIEYMKGGILNTREMTQITEWVAMGFEPEAIAQACAMTYSNNGRLTWGYVKALLNGWFEKGILTGEAAKKHAESIQKSRGEDVNKTHFYVLKVLDKRGNWYTNALVENSFDAVHVAKLYRDQLGYTVQIWHKEKNVSFLMNSKDVVVEHPQGD